MIHGDSEWHEGLLLYRNLRLSALEIGILLRLKWRWWRHGMLGLCFRSSANISRLGNLESCLVKCKYFMDRIKTIYRTKTFSDM